jgi:acetyltransferase-like isoleucine patch superfamily enzyme
MKRLIFNILRPIIPERFVKKITANYISPLATIGKNGYLYKTDIGDFTYLAVKVSVMNTSIGKFCSIGQGACISLGMHPASKFVSTHPVFFSPHKQGGISFTNTSHFREMGHTTIGNDVWIGVNAIIMDDISIGNGAIVGAGAIVTKDVPPYAIVVGNPAKVLRYRFEPEEIDFLLDFKWWDRDVNWLKQNYLKFHDIKLLMSEFKK